MDAALATPFVEVATDCSSYQAQAAGRQQQANRKLGKKRIRGRQGRASMQLLPDRNDQLALLKLANEWLVRALVLLSLATHLVLLFAAGIRRRRAIGVRTTLVWLSYQVAGWAATHSISNLMLGIITSREQQLHAFWTPFLLMHLALPDSISAYSLEDNALSSRQLVRAPAQVIGAIFILCKHVIFVHNPGNLLPASYLMFSLGIAKYMESVRALRRGNLGSIRRSIKKMKKPKDLSDAERLGHDFDNEQALLIAHGLLHISMGAFADYSFGRLRRDKYRRERPFSRSRGWQDMCKVVQMELSLVYDVMYTKAAVGHTWLGYCIRVVSPPFTAAALLLFWSDSKDGQSREGVIITYTLLIVTLVLDVGCLLGTLGSTWTCAFLKHRRYWLLQCSLGRSHRLIRGLAFIAVKDPTSYRLWSGTIGQYNLLSQRCHTTMSISSKLIKIVATTDSWMEYQYGYSRAINIAMLPCVRNLLFREVWKILKSVFPPEDRGTLPTEKKKDEKKKDEEKAPPPKKEEMPNQQDGLRRQSELGDALNFGPEFQEVVLRWHIATDIFLLCRPRSTAASGSSSSSSSSFRYEYVKAIQALSNYMMFLVAVRPGMLPGLYLRSMHDATREAVNKTCCRHHATADPQGGCTASPRDEKELAEILLAMEAKTTDSNNGSRSRLHDSSIILSDGTVYAGVMLDHVGAKVPKEFFSHRTLKARIQLWYLVPGLRYQHRLLEMQEMLDLILGAWVRLLIHASTRCSRGSHATQLSRGGDLTTVVWILAEHAGIFRIPADN